MLRRVVAVVLLDARRRVRDRTLIGTVVLVPLALVLSVAPIANGVQRTFGATRPRVFAITADAARARTAAAVAHDLNIDLDVGPRAPTTLDPYTGVVDLQGAVARATVIRSGQPAAAVVRQFAALASGVRPVAGLLDRSRVDRSSRTTRTFYSIGFAQMIVVLLLGVGTRQLAAEVRGGISLRMRSTGLGAWAFAGGKLLSYAVTAAAALLVSWALTVAIVRVSWGSAFVVLVVSAGLAVACSGLALLCAVFTKTARQSQAMATLLGALMVMAGGSFVPIWHQPGWLVDIARLVPTGLALRAQFSSAVGEGAFPATALVLFAIGAIAFAISCRRLRTGTT